jgi:hypothetical protein
MDDNAALPTEIPPAGDVEAEAKPPTDTRTPDTLLPQLALLPYQVRICEFLKRHDVDVWRWFASTRQQARHVEDVKFDLLKSTYRIDRESQSPLYDSAQEVALALGLSAPITLYQAQDPSGLNASMVYVPGEVHIVFHGPIATQLTPTELRGLLGHELTHYLLRQGWNGDLLIASEMLAALANDQRAHPAHSASWRLLRLYTEIACDRGSFLVTRDVLAAVSMLVKVYTGVQEVNPESYLRQAEEIFAHGPGKTEGVTHPEAFIRARAIRLWSEQGAQADDAIAEMIESGTDLTDLDLLRQEIVAGWTRRVLDLLLCRKWFQTDPVLAHARLYFEDYTAPAELLTDQRLVSETRLNGKGLRDYFCFLLLDFATSDRELEEAPLAAAFQVAEQLGIQDRFAELARQELRLRKNQIDRVKDRRDAILREADQAGP